MNERQRIQHDLRRTTLESTEPAAYFARVDSPLGSLLLVAAEDGTRAALRGIYFEAERHAVAAIPGGAREDELAFVDVRKQLDEYFAGRRRSFELPLAPLGTAFQRQVWEALRAIPYGTTTTYAAIARSIGRPLAVRAVGAANGKNPLSIVVPCHRVIGKDGTLTGYAGGLPIKRRLLELESARASLP